MSSFGYTNDNKTVDVAYHNDSNLNTKEKILTKDGNFLFYNSPVVAKFKKDSYVAYLTRMGQVIVNLYNNKSDKETKQFFVHNYSENIKRVNKFLKENNFSDDHAAPAIIADKSNDRILLVTSYHGSELYIYEFSKNTQKFSLLKKISGRFTYPRLIRWENDILLFIRKQPKHELRGDLVVFSSKDQFSKEVNVLKSVIGEVVYASKPANDEDGIYFTYSMHNYKEKRLIGWNIIKYNPDSSKILWDYDLSNYLPDVNYTNRPTAINIHNRKLLIGTSFIEISIAEKKDRFFNRTGTVIILRIDLDTLKKEIIHENISVAPYYCLDIYIDEKLNYFYFDKDNVVSNQIITTECFHHQYMMYPNLIDNTVYFAVPNNNSYSIRDFNNSIIQCENYVQQ